MLMRLAPALSTVKIARGEVAVVIKIREGVAENDMEGNDIPEGVIDEERSNLIQLSSNLTQQFAR